MIKILPPNLRDQIAAGEVVERPASVIKELVENSIDAGATEIIVTVKKGGRELIQIEDNGGGMSREDARLSLERYATSKIEKLEDLYNIHSFGFRGEALASIASVSEFTLQTKRAEDLSGTSLKIKAGEEQKLEDKGMRTGTKILVENLFYCVPARLKFIKADSTENIYILKTLQNFAITNPQIAFKYINNAKTVFDLYPEEKSLDGIQQRLYKIFRKDLIAEMQAINLDLGYLKITGFTVNQAHPQSNRNYQYVFVNQRNIEDRTIKSAVTESYRNLIPGGTFPAYFLFLEIAPEMVDVNVHPRKTEVKFLRPQEIYQAVKKSILETFSTNQIEFSRTYSSLPGNSWGGVQNSSFKASYSKSFKVPPSQSSVSMALDFSKNILKTDLVNSSDRQIAEFQQFQTESDDGWKIIGQVAQSYIAVEKDQSFYLIDQHAADERVKYEEVKNKYLQKTQFLQKLLIPVKVELTTIQKEILEANLDKIEKLGFEVNYMGGKTFLINAVPQELYELNIEDVFQDLLDELFDDFKNQKDFSILMEKNFKYIACRSAVMFGDTMSLQEMHYLVKTIFDHPEYKTCPHGRPFLWEIPFEELNQKFKR